MMSAHHASDQSKWCIRNVPTISVFYNYKRTILEIVQVHYLNILENYRPTIMLLYLNINYREI